MAAKSHKRVAIITGGSSGIGQEIACELSKRGYAVAICGRNKERLDSTSRLCQENGADSEDVLQIIGDLADPQSPDRIVSATLEKFGRINALINNAGFGKVPDSLQTVTAESFDQVFSVNIRGPVLLTKACMPHLEKTKGTVINISSAITEVPAFPLLVYPMTKAAMNFFTKHLACAYGVKGVRVCGIMPGYIQTPAHQTGMPLSSEEELAAHAQKLMDAQIVSRVGQVGDVAKAVAFLLSDEASFITGETLVVDGGWQLHVSK
ncbi:2-(R)-hydroxypropyl-CoM dehydrogenase-like [Liolophura sinensis]|uniref:2-(R)-hydroxypropyl-CoM dehydrogenase-like n=1 Tax=Liolophura sinensis TaxID=3198878 RepID=UPI0031595130